MIIDTKIFGSNIVCSRNVFTFMQVLAPGKRVYIDDGLISVLTKEALHAITSHSLKKRSLGLTDKIYFFAINREHLIRCFSMIPKKKNSDINISRLHCVP
jgi:hypothetical protein